MTNRIIATIAKSRTHWLQVMLSDFRGRWRVDVRICALFGESAMAGPTKKGITIKIQSLPDLIAAFRQAETEARRLGVLK